MLICGPPGVGKSTLAASSPNPIFLAAENGLQYLHATAYDPTPRTYHDVLRALREIAEDSTFETFVVDTLNWVEPIVWAHVGTLGKKMAVEDYGYQDGYRMAAREFRPILKELEAINERKNIILLAHVRVRTRKNPEGDDYEAMAVSVHDLIGDLITQWVNVVGYLTTDATVGKAKGDRVAKATESETRILRMRSHPAYPSKSRPDAPERIEIPKDGGWDAMMRALGSELPKAPQGSTCEGPETENGRIYREALEMLAEHQRVANPEYRGFVDRMARFLEAPQSTLSIERLLSAKEALFDPAAWLAKERTARP